MPRLTRGFDSTDAEARRRSTRRAGSGSLAFAHPLAVSPLPPHSPRLLLLSLDLFCLLPELLRQLPHQQPRGVGKVQRRILCAGAELLRSNDLRPDGSRWRTAVRRSQLPSAPAAIRGGG